MKVVYYTDPDGAVYCGPCAEDAKDHIQFEQRIAVPVEPVRCDCCGEDICEVGE